MDVLEGEGIEGVALDESLRKSFGRVGARVTAVEVGRSVGAEDDDAGLKVKVNSEVGAATRRSKVERRKAVFRRIVIDGSESSMSLKEEDDRAPH